MQNQYIVSEESQSVRIDSYLSIHTDMSRSYIQSLIKNNKVLLNGKPTKTSTKLEIKDIIKLVDIEPVQLAIEPENIPINVIYQDDDIAIINKQKDIVVHPAPGNYTGTLVNALLYHCKDLSGINGVMRPGIVHRIDKDTTGLLVIAKNDTAHTHLAQQLADHSINRSYRALVFGNLKQDQITIEAPIGRNEKDRKQMAVTNKNSREAITNINALERFFHKGTSYTYIKATLKTGRTHQIRVHMSHIGHPVVGDTVYGYKKQPFKTNGQMLHAKELGFVHPNKNYMNFESDLPEYFSKILNNIKNS